MSTPAWPGLAYPGETYPGVTSVSVVDTRPSDHVRVECAFTTAPDAATPAWEDLTSRLHLPSRMRITRGRGERFANTQAGTCQLALKNDDGALTPGLTSGAYYPDVKPRKKLRVTYRDPQTSGNFCSANQASMETSVADWFSNNALGALTTATSIAQSASHPGHGTQGGLVTWPTTAVGSMAMTNVTGLTIGRTYTASLKVWVPVGHPNVWLDVLFNTAGAATSTKGSLVTISVTFTALDVSQAIGPRVASATSGQQCWFDALMVDEGTAVAAFTTTPADDHVLHLHTGLVDEWDPHWPGGGGLHSLTRVTSTDELARWGNSRKMRSVVEETILGLGPHVYYPLGEPVGSTAAGDIAGQVGALPLAKVQFGTDGTLDFGLLGGPGTDGLSAPKFEPVDASNGLLLRTDIPDNGFGNQVGFTAVTVACGFLSPITAARDQTMMNLSSYADNLVVGRTSTGAVRATYEAGFEGATPVFTLTSPSTAYDDNKNHEVAVVVTANGSQWVAKLYVDGASVATSTVTGRTMYLPIMTRLNVGGRGQRSDPELFTGSLSHVAVWGAELTALQVADVSNSMDNGFAGERTDQRITRYLDWLGQPVGARALDTGATTGVTFTETTGQEFIKGLQDMERTESGRLFIDGRGRVTFHARSRSYTPTTATVIPGRLLDRDASFPESIRDVVNDFTATRPGGGSVRRTDDASVAAYGTLEASTELSVVSDTDLEAAVYWRLLEASQSRPRVPEVSVDAYTDAAEGATVRGLELGDVISLTTLPSQAPATTIERTVEGLTHDISLTGWSVSITSSRYQRVSPLIFDDATYGQWDAGYSFVY